jgi:hypothetical protein
MHVGSAAVLLFLPTLAVADDRLERFLTRLAEEAEVFLQVAPQTLSEETLQQKTTKKPTRFRLRLGAPASGPPQPQFQTREIVSEYGYSTFEDSPNVLHEFRQVVSVDGRVVRSREAARRTLSLGVSSREDRAKRQMLRELQDHGLTSVAVDLGQIILLFTKRQLVNYQFQWTGRGQLNSADASVFSFEQVGGAGSVTIFAGRRASRETLQGEVWVRESDCLPLRISIVTQREVDKHSFRDEATVDYSMSPHAALLPVSVVHREYIDGHLEIEDLFRYAAFRRFSAEAEIKFTPEPPE